MSLPRLLCLLLAVAVAITPSMLFAQCYVTEDGSTYCVERTGLFGMRRQVTRVAPRTTTTYRYKRPVRVVRPVRTVTRYTATSANESYGSSGSYRAAPSLGSTGGYSQPAVSTSRRPSESPGELLRQETAPKPRRVNLADLPPRRVMLADLPSRGPVVVLAE